MSYSEERMMILKMLQEGKITSEEAARLLEAIDGSKGSGRKRHEEEMYSGRKDENRESRYSHRHGNTNGYFGQFDKQAFNDELNRMRDRVHQFTNDFKKNINQKDFEKTINEFASKAEKIGKDVASATYGVVDKVVDFVSSYVDTSSFNFFGSYPLVEKTYAAELTEGTNISIEAVNGPITVRRHSEKNIFIKTKIKGPQNTAHTAVVFNTVPAPSEDKANTTSTEGESHASDQSVKAAEVSISLNKGLNLSVSHEIYLPETILGTVRFITSNSRIDAEDIKARSVECITSNSHIALTGITTDLLKAVTKNAKIILGYVSAKTMDLNASNALLDMRNIKSSSLNAVTMNGRISAENLQGMEGEEALKVSFRTSNGNIRINMNDLENKAYRIKARTTNGYINLLIPDLVYKNPVAAGIRSSFTEAESQNYPENPDKVDIIAETTNGIIEVIK